MASLSESFSAEEQLTVLTLTSEQLGQKYPIIKSKLQGSLYQRWFSSLPAEERIRMISISIAEGMAQVAPIAQKKLGTRQEAQSINTCKLADDIAAAIGLNLFTDIAVYSNHTREELLAFIGDAIDALSKTSVTQ